MLAISRVIVPISGFGQNLSVVRFKAPTKLKLCVFIDLELRHLFSFQSLGQGSESWVITDCSLPAPLMLDKRKF